MKLIIKKQNRHFYRISLACYHYIFVSSGSLEEGREIPAKQNTQFF